MKLYPNLVEGRFIVRLNRFLAMVEVDGHQVPVHVANSGRMKELLVPGFRVLLREKPGQHRKTAYDLALVDLGWTLASADARLPNELVSEALTKGYLQQFNGYPVVRREVTFGESRLDILLESPEEKCFIETKSVTLVVNDIGLFPDAPTTRGVKHVLSLVHAREAGHRAAVVFVVQRRDAHSFSPHHEADPDFSEALKNATAAGVEVYAYNCRVSEQEVTLDRSLQVLA